jgi:hypothetical protein
LVHSPTCNGPCRHTHQHTHAHTHTHTHTHLEEAHNEGVGVFDAGGEAREAREPAESISDDLGQLFRRLRLGGGKGEGEGMAWGVVCCLRATRRVWKCALAPVTLRTGVCVCVRELAGGLGGEGVTVKTEHGPLALMVG